MDIVSAKGCPAIPEVTPRSIQVALPVLELRYSDRSSEDYPPVPPNTARQSGQSSAMHSEPQTPEDDEDGIELKASAFLANPRAAALSRSATPSNDYLAVPRRSSLPASPSISHRLSDLSTEELSFRSHRDSVEITQGHLRRQELEGKMNQQLQNAHRDSFVLTKSKFDCRYPKGGLTTTQSWSRFGGLSPIIDASPPNSYGWRSRSVKIVPSPQRSPGEVEKKLEDAEAGETHPDEHIGCPIYEVERPRWFESKYR